MSVHTHVALNAYLLSGEASYRSAGIHGYIYNTLANLCEVDPSLVLTVLVGSGTLPDRGRWDVRRSRFLAHRPTVRIMWEQLVVPWMLLRLDPDLFHGMAFAVPAFWPGPSVVTIYDLSFLRYPEHLGRARRLYLQWITHLSARRARRIISISESGKAEINALLHVAPDKIDVALPGVAEHFKSLPPEQVAKFRARQGLPERFILYLGTLEPRKNLDTLLVAYARLPQRAEVKLVLAGGEGWGTDRILALIESLGLREDVILPGYIENRMLPMWYNAAELFVYPSMYEGFGLPLLEAMACCVPVVASNAASLPEVVGSDGVLLPATNPDAWTDALAHLLTDSSARMALGLRGQARAKNFTWTNTARQTALAYHRALSDST